MFVILIAVCAWNLFTCENIEEVLIDYNFSFVLCSIDILPSQFDLRLLSVTLLCNATLCTVILDFVNVILFFSNRPSAAQSSCV